MIGGRGAQALLLQQRLSIVQDGVSFSDMVESSRQCIGFHMVLLLVRRKEEEDKVVHST